MMRRLVIAMFAALLAPQGAASQERGANALGDAIAELGTTMRVLVIAAHPDDEDTRLITWLTKGHRAEVAYLSLTRGDGGQNLIGNELGEALGVIRTEELLTARRLDGAHQYFTRAYDFGFSKSAEETYKHWPHDSLLKDVVTVVREFRPHVIVTVFTGTRRDGHGQHQVSAILGREAYDLAGDSVRFPAKSTRGLVPWTVSKFYRGRSYFGPPYSIAYNAGDYDPLLGLSFAELAVISRSQHRSQGTGALPRKGSSPGYLMREATRVNAGTDSTKETTIFDGVDTKWTRLNSTFDCPEGHVTLDSLDKLAASMRSTARIFDQEALVRPLMRADVLIGRLMGSLFSRGYLPSGCVNTSRGQQLLDAQATVSSANELVLVAELNATGVVIEAIAARPIVAIGDSVEVTVTAFNRGRLPIRLVRFLGPWGGSIERMVAPDSSVSVQRYFRAERITQPEWLTQPRRGDIFENMGWHSEDANVTTMIEVPIADLAHDPGLPYPLIRSEGSIVYRFADPVKGAKSHPLLVAPAVTLTLDTQVEYVPANGAIDRTMHVRLRSASTAACTVKVSLKTPKGLAADSASRTVQLAAFGSAVVDFKVRGTLPVGTYTLSAVAESNGQTFTTGYQLIDYDHIRPQTMYRDATVTLQAVDVVIPPGANIAYIPGVGDNSAPALQQLGVPVTVLDPATLATADLSPYTAIVIGSRAYEAHPELVANNARLLDWVKRGGTMVVQYGQYEMTQPGILPYPITLTRPAARVTEENATVTVLAPRNPLLLAPNAIGPNDWKGWVQDFALYMPTTFDSAYTPLVSMHDSGEPANSGGLLVASYGRGTYVYATLAFFRQLPAGVPGAARLFVNLLGARQADAPRTTP